MTAITTAMPLNPKEIRAIRHLWEHTILGTHPQTKDAYILGASMLDVDALTDTTWRWSSGEQVLIDVVLCMTRCLGTFDLNRIDVLDLPSRKALIEALSFRYAR